MIKLKCSNITEDKIGNKFWLVNTLIGSDYMKDDGYENSRCVLVTLTDVSVTTGSYGGKNINVTFRTLSEDSETNGSDYSAVIEIKCIPHSIREDAGVAPVVMKYIINNKDVTHDPFMQFEFFMYPEAERYEAFSEYHNWCDLRIKSFRKHIEKEEWIVSLLQNKFFAEN